MSISSIVDFQRELASLGFLLAPGENDSLLVYNLGHHELPHHLTTYIKENKPDIIQQLLANTYPATSAQKEIWLESKINDNSTHHIVAAYYLHGELDIERFSSCLIKLILEHSIFSTNFFEKDNTLFAIENKNRFSFIRCITVNDINEAKNEIAKGFKERFNLESDNLYRFGLYHIKNKSYIFSACIHHIIFDEESKKTFILRLLNLYQGNKYIAEKIPFKYYALWNHEYVNQSQCNIFWKDKLSRHQPIHIPMLLKHSRNQRCNVLTYKLNILVSNKINMCAKKNNLSLLMFFVTAINLFCYRYSDNSTITISTPYANRPHSELFHTIGYFLETIYIISDIYPEMSLSQYFSYIRNNCLDTYSHSISSINESYISEPSFKNLLNRIRLVVINDDSDKSVFPKMQIEPIPWHLHNSKFDFLIKIVSNDQITIQFEYNASISHSLIKYFTHNFNDILKKMIDNSNMILAEFKKPAAKDLQLYHRINNKCFKSPAIVHNHIWPILELELTKNPELVRLVYHHKNYTSADILQYIANLKHIIKKTYCHNIKTIVFYLSNKLDQAMVCLTAICMGSTFIPLDNEDNSKRILNILTDSNADLVITDKNLKKKVVDVCPRHMLVLDDLPINQFYNSKFESEENEPNSPLYRLYTSGSTGTPKGVNVSHHAFIAYLEFAMNEIYNDHQISHVACQSSFCFDFSMTTFLVPLALGKKVVIIDSDQFNSLEVFLDQLEKHKIHLIKITPSFFSVFTKYFIKNHNKKLLTLRRIVLGGEMVPQKLVSEWYSNFNNQITLLNHYGPTEAVVGVMTGPISAHMPFVSLGKLRHDIKAFLLTKDKDLCPVGQVGELYLASDCLADEYYNAPTLLNESFIQSDKFNNLPFKLDSRRVYRTGDRAFLDPTGQIIFVERLKDYVKINGYRVSLNEIKIATLQHNDVNNVIVIYDNAFNHGLCLFYTSGNFIVSPQELRQFLIAQLPLYMIPQHFIMVDGLPTNLNGKIDEGSMLALIKPETSREISFVQLDDKQQALHQIVEISFKNKRLSPKHNFYELGGDSILAIKIISSFHQAGYFIGIQDFLRAETLLEIYERTSTITTDLATQDISLLPMQEIFFNQNNTHVNYFCHFVLLRLNSNSTSSSNSGLINRLLESHDAFSYGFFQTESSVQLKKIKAGIELVYERDFEIADHTLSLLQQKILHKINIELGPLLIINYIENECGNYLFLCCHHLVIDHYSWYILLQEIDDYLKSESNITIKSKHNLSHYTKELTTFCKSKQHLSDDEFWFKQIQRININTLSQNRSYPYHTFQQISDSFIVPLSLPSSQQSLILGCLFAALSISIATDQIYADIETHGRTPPFYFADIHHTIGWLRGFYPYIRDHFSATEPKSRLKYFINDYVHYLNSIPNNGYTYPLLIQDSQSRIFQVPQPDININFTTMLSDNNQFENFVIEKLPQYPITHPENVITYPLNILLQISEQSVKISCLFSQLMFNITELKKLINEFNKNLCLLNAVHYDEIMQ